MIMQKERKLVDSKFPHVDMFLNYKAPGLDEEDYLSDPTGRAMWDRGNEAGKSRVKKDGPLGKGMTIPLKSTFFLIGWSNISLIMVVS